MWALLTDVAAMAGLGPEHVEAGWQGEPGLGTVFVGRNRIGSREWQVDCHVVVWEPPRRFGFSVLDPAKPSSRWDYTLTPDGEGTMVVQQMTHGPGPSGVRAAVEQVPDQAAQILADRAATLARNMQAVLTAADVWLSREHR